MAEPRSTHAALSEVPHSYGAAQRWLRNALADAGVDDAAADAKWLMEFAARASSLLALQAPDHALDVETRAAIAAAAHRRASGEPVSRIVGRREFYGLDLALGPATLDPRAETETVVEVVLALLAEHPELGNAAPLRILDIGTGSGAIALALLSTLPSALAVATDISREALAMAAENARRLGLDDRLTLREARWADDVEGPFQVVVSNPPYVRSGDIDRLATEVRRWDPRAALDGGIDGLEAYRAILPAMPRLLAPGGFVVLEVGHDQALQVEDIARCAGLMPAKARGHDGRDLGGHRRCIAATTTGRR